MSRASVAPHPATGAVGVVDPVIRPVRAWPGVVVFSVFWLYCIVTERMDLPAWPRFLSQMAALALALLVFLIWWLSRSRFTWSQRLAPLGAVVAIGAAIGFVADRSMAPVLIHRGIPAALSAWAVALALAPKGSAGLRIRAAIAAMTLTGASFTLLKLDGMRGSGRTELSWRWSRTPEERFLAERTARKPALASATTSPAALSLEPGDWAEFRGPRRDGVVREVRINTDWNSAPPKLRWRERVGPGWSSVAVVGGRVFTQEQRGEKEAVVCRDAATGSELWIHEDLARFWEALGGAGPRATPTFDQGAIYTQGAMGLLNCLDAMTGQLRWQRDIAAEAGAKAPLWGFSSSPLLAAGKVIVYAGGEGTKNLLAYDATSGAPAWTASAGKHSYSSPQLVSIGGEQQVLMFSDRGLMSFSPADGRLIWEHVALLDNPRSLQPHLVGTASFILGWGLDVETRMLEVHRSGDGYNVSERWSSRFMKPSFNDLVVHEGFVYGFDGSIFGCIEAATGQRKWKKGRYGNGQVLLLADQGVLLVLSEDGEVVLMAADPGEHRELGRMQAISGKTWNHPVIAQGRLFVRSSEEMACYELR